MSRRWLLGASLSGVGAVAVARHLEASAPPRWPGPDPRYYLVARESPVYDPAFATFAESLSVQSGDELVLRVRASAPFHVHVERVDWGATGWGHSPMLATESLRVDPVDDSVQPRSWPVAVRTRVPDGWRSGLYMAVRLDDETMTCHKAARFDDDPHDNITGLWRSPLVGRPEHELLGSWYEAYQFPYGSGHDWTVTDAEHWFYEGTGLTDGASLPGLVGYEWDHAPRPVPAGVRVLSSTEFVDADGDRRRHEATERTHPGGGVVINVGTTYWPRFLVGDARFRNEPLVERMTHNVLNRHGSCER